MPTQLHGKALVIHGGGPTPVLNASLAGVISAARDCPEIESLLGARFGVDGALRGDFFNLFAQLPETLEALRHAPGSAIGSSRRHMREDDYAQLHELLARQDIRFVFVTGGNGTQETGLRILKMAERHGYEMRVMGIPKTIDNDLGYTHFSPGYPSAARFFAQAVRDIGEDNRSLPTPINVTEVLGRNVGWVVGATVLARAHPDDAPHLVYLPEHPVSEDHLCADVERVYRRLGRCVVAICEGQRNTDGDPFGAESHAAPGSRDRLASNLGHQVAAILTQRLGVRARSEKPGLLGRSSAVDIPHLDREAAFGCGVSAVRQAVQGNSGCMVTIERVDAATGALSFGSAALNDVAMMERSVPRDWIAPEGNDITQAFRDYAQALVGSIVAHPRLSR
ncbi:MAG: diphosphate--fructose-6-phosphate 1-phosphotransferase [Bryobacterales bacterium]|nr:diphosphate--fructose-6-phosphate 1-phosphotransferase [Bryobacterales bacterium]